MSLQLGSNVDHWNVEFLALVHVTRVMSYAVELVRITATELFAVLTCWWGEFDIGNTGWWAWHECCPPLMMTSSNGNFFRVTGHLCGEFTGPR